MKIDRITLEQESESKLDNEHTCEQNELPDQLRIFHVRESYGKEKDHYELFSVWISDMSDVQRGEALEVGEILNLSSIKVQYCPFCGHYLKGNRLEGE